MAQLPVPNAMPAQASKAGYRKVMQAARRAYFTR